MHDSLAARLRDLNARWNGLPRKALWVAVALGTAAAALFALPYGWPFVLAFLFSRLLEKPVRWMTRRLGLSRRAASALGLALLFGLTGAAASALATRLFQELAGLLRALPQVVNWLADEAAPRVREAYEHYRALLPAWVAESLGGGLTLLGQDLVKWAGALSAALTSGAWSTAASIPYALFSVVLTVMGTYYMTADRERIAAFFRRQLPRGAVRRGSLIRLRLWRALMGQVRSQLLVSLAITGYLMAALAAFRIPYGLLLGLLIGLLDALPVLGAGLFLLPWSLISFLGGNAGRGILLAALYVGAVVIRQVLEPRIVGRHLGLYPLATMASMFAAYRLMGFVGLLAGPVFLNMVKVILEADAANLTEPS